MQLVQAQIPVSVTSTERSHWYSPLAEGESLQTWEEIINRAQEILSGLDSDPIQIETEKSQTQVSGHALLLASAPRIRITERGRTKLVRAELMPGSTNSPTVFGKMKRRLLDNKYVAVIVMAAVVVGGLRRLMPERLFDKEPEDSVALSPRDLPVFELSASLVEDPSDAYYANDVLVVDNAGGPALELRCSVMTFLRVRVSPSGGIHRETLFPLANYYAVQGVGSSVDGRVFSARNHHTAGGNMRRLRMFALEFRALAAERNAFGSVDIDRFVRLAYKDVSRASHDDIYFVRSVGPARRLSENEASDLLDLRKRQIQAGMQFSLAELSAPKVYEAWLLHSQ
jgi:hypothetical protein